MPSNTLMSAAVVIHLFSPIETQCKEAEHKEKMKIAGNPLRDEGQGAIAALVFSPTEGRQQEQRRSEREETNS